MSTDNVVETQLDCIGVDGERRRVAVEIGRPNLNGEGDWSCSARIRGLYEPSCDVLGVDALQAICLSLTLLRSVLSEYIRSGGRVMHPDTDEAYELNTTFSAVGTGT